MPHHGDNSYDDDWSKFGSSRNNVKKIYRKPAGSNKINVGFTPAKSYSEFTSGKSTSNSKDNKEEQRCKVTNLYGENDKKNESHGHDSYGNDSYRPEPESYEEFTARTNEGNDSYGKASYGKKDDHDSYGFDNNYDFGFGDKSPGYHQSRGNAKTPRSSKRESVRSNVGKKTVAGQTDHTPQPH